MFEWFFELLGFPGKGYGLDELSRRLDVPVDELTAFQPKYREFSIPKGSGGRRKIEAPSNDLKQLQRRILRRLLSRLKAHPAAMGFERGKSFVTNAKLHEGQAVVIQFDIINFFPSIISYQVREYFRAIGWNRKAVQVLGRLVTWRGRLPQGAPTSPRLSNLINYGLDARIAALVKPYEGVYTRYADDITVSLDKSYWDLHPLIGGIISILRSAGYRPHLRKKFSVRRQHQRQEVTGLVVNQRAQLPRSTRRWLRAVEHRARHYWREGQPMEASEQWQPVKYPTITKEQLDGWRALVKMIDQEKK